MTPTDRFLRNILAVQGAFYLGVNVWALVSTRQFLSYSNPQADLFEARSFAALNLVTALYFLAGAWRAELQRPAAFLGLGSALAIGLVELFHLPELGWSLLWIDLFVEIAIAALYVNVLFFRREPAAEPAETADDAVAPAAAPADVPAPSETPPSAADLPPETIDEPLFPDERDGDDGSGAR